MNATHHDVRDFQKYENIKITNLEYVESEVSPGDSALLLERAASEAPTVEVGSFRFRISERTANLCCF